MNFDTITIGDYDGLDPSIAWLPVHCISIRESKPDQISVGHAYVIDRMTIWLDSDGDAFGVVYDMRMRRIGEMKLSHFSCL